MTKETNRVKHQISSGTSYTWTNGGGTKYLRSVTVATDSGTINGTIDIDHVVDSNDLLLASATDTALESVVYLPENLIQVEKGDSVKVTSTVSSTYNLTMTFTLPE